MNELGALAKKLQIKPGKCWLFYNAPGDYLAVLEPLPTGAMAIFTPKEYADGIQLFVKDSLELAGGLKVIAPMLKPETVLWITYPKKSSGIKSDLEMMGSWDEPAKYGLRPVAAVSVNDIWTAVRLRPEGQSKISESGNQQIPTNQYGDYIDVKNRQINLPDEMKAVLQDKPNALSFFQSLSFSNKKEYVVWILSAKQEKTKAERLDKLVEKLSAGKKNPSEK